MRTKHGFTLIEVLVAIAVLGIAISMLSYFGGSLVTVRKSQTETLGLSFARSYLDLVRTNWQYDLQFTAATLPNTQGTSADVSLPPNYTYDLTLSIPVANGTVNGTLNPTAQSWTNLSSSSTTPAPVADNAALRQVTVTVKDATGNVSASLSTIIRDPATNQVQTVNP